MRMKFLPLLARRTQQYCAWLCKETLRLRQDFPPRRKNRPGP
jgi:hypothetical protein